MCACLSWCVSACPGPVTSRTAVGTTSRCLPRQTPPALRLPAGRVPFPRPHPELGRASSAGYTRTLRISLRARARSPQCPPRPARAEGGRRGRAGVAAARKCRSSHRPPSSPLTFSIDPDDAPPHPRSPRPLLFPSNPIDVDIMLSHIAALFVLSQTAR